MSLVVTTKHPQKIVSHYVREKKLSVLVVCLGDAPGMSGLIRAQDSGLTVGILSGKRFEIGRDVTVIGVESIFRYGLRVPLGAPRLNDFDVVIIEVPE